MTELPERTTLDGMASLIMVPEASIHGCLGRVSEHEEERHFLVDREQRAPKGLGTRTAFAVNATSDLLLL